MPLAPGSTLAYSAGTSARDPYSFRVVTPAEPPLVALARRAPWLLGWLFERVPVVINAYPAPIQPPPNAVFVDSYLSPRVASRALALAAAEGTAAVLVAQPLLAARLLLHQRETGAPLPGRLLLVSGGYPLPASLRRALATWAGAGCDLRVVELYGVAEVDAGCLVSVGDDPSPVWTARADVEWRIDGDGGLHLRRRDQPTFHATGDRATAVGDGLVLDSTRLAPAIRDELATFDAATWARRTGYRADGRWLLRADAETPGALPSETDAHGAIDWTSKPDWTR